MTESFITEVCFAGCSHSLCLLHHLLCRLGHIKVNTIIIVQTGGD